MHRKKIFRNLFGILALTGGLFLAACSDATSGPTSNSSTTAPVTPFTAASGTPSTTTPTATTIAATTVSPSTVVGTTAPVMTPALTTATGTTASGTTLVGTTAPAHSQTAGWTPEEFLANIPNTPEYLKIISFNNYVSFRQMNNLPENTSFQEILKDKEAFARFNFGLRFSNPARITDLSHLQTLRNLAGFDIFQTYYDAEAGQPPNLISLAQGKYDTAAIDKAWLAGGAAKSTVGPNISYTIDKLDLQKELQQIFIGPQSLVSVPDKSMLIYGKPPAAAAAVAGELPSKNPITSNPALKGLLDVFGDPVSIYMGTALIGSALDNLPPNLNPGAAKDAFVATIKARQPIPAPTMGGVALYQDAAGARYYLAANYYPNEASAKAAETVLVDQLKNGTSFRSRSPYSQYWEVASSEVKGNVLVVKLNWKSQSGLPQFIFARDFPFFQY